MIKQKNNYLIIVLWTIILSILMPVSVFGADDSAKNKNVDDVTLQAAVLLDSEMTTIRFKLTNNSDKQFDVSPFMVNDNQIFITTPSGNKVDLNCYKWGIKPLLIEPNTSKVWDINVSTIFSEVNNFKEKGIYHLIWIVKEYKSNEILFEKP